MLVVEALTLLNKSQNSMALSATHPNGREK